MEIYLIRHGQSQSNAGLTTHLDSDLTETGKEQAARTAAHLQGIGLSRAYVSPLRRTLQTMGAICGTADLRAELTPEICEYFSPHYPGFKTFPGLSPDEISTEFPFAFTGDTFPCEVRWWPQDFETDADIYARAVRVRDALLARYAATEEKLVLVSHSDTVGRLTEAFLRQQPVLGDPLWSDNCGITLLACDPDPQTPAQLVYRNDTAHLQGLIT